MLVNARLYLGVMIYRTEEHCAIPNRSLPCVFTNTDNAQLLAI
jgi:hypothetical protein